MPIQTQSRQIGAADDDDMSNWDKARLKKYLKNNGKASTGSRVQLLAWAEDMDQAPLARGKGRSLAKPRLRADASRRPDDDDDDDDYQNDDGKTDPLALPSYESVKPGAGEFEPKPGRKQGGRGEAKKVISPNQAAAISFMKQRGGARIRLHTSSVETRELSRYVDDDDQPRSDEEGTDGVADGSPTLTSLSENVVIELTRVPGGLKSQFERGQRVRTGGLGLVINYDRSISELKQLLAMTVAALKEMKIVEENDRVENGAEDGEETQGELMDGTFNIKGNEVEVSVVRSNADVENLLGSQPKRSAASSSRLLCADMHEGAYDCGLPDSFKESQAAIHCEGREEEGDDEDRGGSDDDKGREEVGHGAAVDREAEFRNAVLKAFEKEQEVHLDELLEPLNSALEGLGAAPFDDEDAESPLLSKWRKRICSFTRSLSSIGPRAPIDHRAGPHAMSHIRLNIYS